MSSPRKITVEFHTLPLVEGGTLWIRELRDDSTFRLWVRSEVASRSSIVNPFTTKPK